MTPVISSAFESGVFIVQIQFYGFENFKIIWTPRKLINFLRRRASSYYFCFVSAFNKKVALAHYTLLAASLPTAQFCDNSHGLSTYERLAEDVLEPSFKSLVELYERNAMVKDGENKTVCTRVNVLQLRRALDDTARALLDEQHREHKVGPVGESAIGA